MNILKHFILLLILTLTLSGCFTLVQAPTHPTSTPTGVVDFATCVAAGYPVMESYPRQCATPDGKNYVESVSTSNNPVRLFSPRSGEATSTPVTIQGEAIGSWFFEASFPVQLVDQNGAVLAQAPAQAEGNWMTADYVPFTVVLPFIVDATTSATLVLKNDNPSGDPAREQKMSIPLTLIPPAQVVSIYLIDGQTGGVTDTDCKRVVAVKRGIKKTTAVGRAAVEQLLLGPTIVEQQQGLATSINSGVQIKSLTIKNSTATIDFDQQIEAGVGGSCRVASIRAQITRTLLQFPAIHSVVISVNGRIDDALQP